MLPLLLSCNEAASSTKQLQAIWTSSRIWARSVRGFNLSLAGSAALTVIYIQKQGLNRTDHHFRGQQDFATALSQKHPPPKWDASPTSSSASAAALQVSAATLHAGVHPAGQRPLGVHTLLCAKRSTQHLELDAVVAAAEDCAIAVENCCCCPCNMMCGGPVMW